MFVPSQYQEDIFRWFADPSGPIAVNAKAGSGKTTTLVQGMNRMRRSGNRLFAAFNSSIVAELKKKLPASVNCQTIHSLGLQTLKSGFPDIKRWDVENGNIKYRQMARDIQVPSEYGDKRVVQDAILSLLNYAQLTLTPLEVDDIVEMAERFGVEIPAECPIDGIAEIVKNMLIQGRQLAEKGIISFSDMLYMPSVIGISPPKYSLVAVDEAQDLSKVQMHLITQAIEAKGNLVAVGDPHQCQPAGTGVLRIVEPAGRWSEAQTETVPIENLKVGDVIATANLRDQCFYGNAEVLDIQTRPYVGTMIKVITEQRHVSEYTPNHRCLASFKPFTGQSMVYLMRKGNQYRVGISTMKEGLNSASLLSRMRCEKADAAWILSFHLTRREALIQEAIISGLYGIPQTVFSDAKLNIKDFASRVWAAIDDNSLQGETVLEVFKRDPKYPLFTNQNNYQQSLHRPQIIAAANLMTGCLMLPYTGTSHFKKRDWLPVSVETREAGLPGFPSYVYSLKVSGTELYIADGLVTHNSIYMFAGAESDSFYQLKDHFDAEELPLNFCYRCPELVIKEAQKIVSDIECPEGTRAGIVETITDESFKNMLKPGDMVLCRLTAPLVKLCFELIKRRIPAKVRGRDIGAQIANVVRQIMKRNTDMGAFCRLMYDWQENQIKVLLDKLGSEDQQQSINDKVDCLAICYAMFNPHSIEGFCADIKNLFSDDQSPITLCTVHRAKGLENPRVFIIKPEKLPLVRKNQTGAQMEQEMNLKYVAVTRAQEELYFVESVVEDNQMMLNPGIKSSL